jgi:hypothetical protein
MFWHVKYRKTNEPHKEHSCTDSDKQLETYIARHTDEYPLSLLEEYRKEAVYSCSDPRLHIRERENVERLTSEAEKRLKDDFETLERVITDYVEYNGRIPYCVVLQCLASWYLGAGILDPEMLNKDYTYRSSPQFSCMFWNLGNWCRSRFSKCPLPEELRKFETHVDYQLDRDREKIGDKPQFNNYVIKVVKNLGAHLFMNCEAQSLYPYRSLFEGEQFTTCFSNDYHDLMVAARVGKNVYVRHIAAYKT